VSSDVAFDDDAERAFLDFWGTAFDDDLLNNHQAGGVVTDSSVSFTKQSPEQA
jgi:hypothetical protein